MLQKTLGLVVIASICLLTACVGLEYPDYWDSEDSFAWNVLSFPIELLFTPIIFVLKLLPVL